MWASFDGGNAIKESSARVYTAVASFCFNSALNEFPRMFCAFDSTPNTTHLWSRFQKLE